jgi:hypothetical protein
VPAPLSWLVTRRGAASRIHPRSLAAESGCAWWCRRRGATPSIRTLCHQPPATDGALPSPGRSRRIRLHDRHPSRRHHRMRFSDRASRERLRMAASRAVGRRRIRTRDTARWRRHRPARPQASSLNPVLGAVSGGIENDVPRARCPRALAGAPPRSASSAAYAEDDPGASCGSAWRVRIAVGRFAFRRARFMESSRERAFRHHGASVIVYPREKEI